MDLQVEINSTSVSTRESTGLTIAAGQTARASPQPSRLLPVDLMSRSHLAPGPVVPPLSESMAQRVSWSRVKFCTKCTQVASAAVSRRLLPGVAPHTRPRACRPSIFSQSRLVPVLASACWTPGSTCPLAYSGAARAFMGETRVYLGSFFATRIHRGLFLSSNPS